MSIFSKLNEENKKNILRLFMLELCKISQPSDRDRFLFKSLKKNLDPSRETIQELKIEAKARSSTEKNEGLIDLKKLMLQIKLEITSEIDSDQAQLLLRSLYDLLNVAGNFSETFLEELCSSNFYHTDHIKTQIQEEEDHLIFDPQPIMSKYSESQSESSNEASTSSIESLDQETVQPKKSLEINTTDKISTSPQNEKKTKINQNDSLLINRYHELIQNLLFPLRDSLIMSLKIDIGDPIEKSFENNIASKEMRLVATCLDSMVILFSLVGPITAIIILGLILSTLGFESIALGFSFIPGLAVFFYYFKFEVTSSSTLGKQWMGLKVCSYDGKPISKKYAIIRALFRVSPLFLLSLTAITFVFSEFAFQTFCIFSILSSILIGLGSIFYYFHKRTQGIHDLISKSLVIRYKQLPK